MWKHILLLIYELQSSYTHTVPVLLFIQVHTIRQVHVKYNNQKDNFIPNTSPSKRSTRLITCMEKLWVQLYSVRYNTNIYTFDHSTAVKCMHM